MIRSPLLLFFFLQLSIFSFASGIKGTVRADDGQPLAYATIFVKQTGTGTTTNESGHFELDLAAGTYTVAFQYLGYESVVRELTVIDDYLELDIILKTQITVLQNVTVRAGKEDPAYTIMRKAIAKATYHQNQLDSYSARVYIKGTGQLTDYPWLAKKALEKEGITKDRVYITESVSEIKYTRPGKWEEKVISIHSDGKDNNTSPNRFIFGSFYEPEIAGTVSPLSPKSFSYYRFEYLGTFKDRDYEISKIRVTPRSRGDNVVEGILNIVENEWSIHSMDVITTKLGIQFGIRSMYAPIEDKAWLPVSHQFKVDGKVFGFEFTGKYLSTLSNYSIQLNPELYVDPEEMEVVDEKLDKEHAREIQKQHSGETAELQKRLESGKEITRKELKTLMKEYEKQEQKQQKEPDVISDVSFSIDSGAYKKDTAYWNTIRPVPLTTSEIRGYEKIDSLAEVERKKEEGDTVKQSKHKGFQPWDIILGDSYKISKHSNFRIHTVGGGFNTVEGFNLIYKLTYGTILQDTNRTRLNITPTLRYAFETQQLSGHLMFTVRNKKFRLQLDGGRYISQYNRDEPIWPIVNTFTTLFLEKNLMKIYERDYVDVLFRRRFNPRYTFEGTASWMSRRELFNTTDYTWINNNNVEGYTPNRPVNEELTDTGFGEHEAFLVSAAVIARPWLKYRIRDGHRQEIEESSPAFSLRYWQGIPEIAGSVIDYSQLELGVRHTFGVGVRGTIHYALQAGYFLNANSMYFMDYKHFLGNLTPFSTNDPVGSFRLLDYYLYSTADKYFSANVHYQFRKFLVTTIPMVRLTGIRENIFVNYLATPTSQNFTELGYSIDGILRIFRLEAAAAFQNGKYQTMGFRIGIATSLRVEFSDN
jgi:hypothetical protein